ncbi:MAG: nitroreductase/quinone reductase family protein, partial [Candidatus Binatia bacterium]
TLSFTVNSPEPNFLAPGWLTRMVNRCYGWLTSVGLGPSYGYLLQIEGRKSGIIHSTPVNVLRYDNKLYLIGTRGHTQWSRNALAAGNAKLKRGRIIIEFSLRNLTDADKPEILRAYLSQFNWMVRRFFPVSTNSSLSEFAAIAHRYPVFELSRK